MGCDRSVAELNAMASWPAKKEEVGNDVGFSRASCCGSNSFRHEHQANVGDAGCDRAGARGRFHSAAPVAPVHSKKQLHPLRNELASNRCSRMRALRS